MNTFSISTVLDRLFVLLRVLLHEMTPHARFGEEVPWAICASEGLLSSVNLSDVHFTGLFLCERLLALRTAEWLFP